MEYTPEEMSALKQDLQSIYRSLRMDDNHPDFYKFKAWDLKKQLPEGAASKSLTKGKIKAILKDLLGSFPLLGRPVGSPEYWIPLGSKQVPELNTSSDLPEGFLEFEEKARAILKRNFTQKKLLDLFQATAPIFQSS